MAQPEFYALAIQEAKAMSVGWRFVLGGPKAGAAGVNFVDRRQRVRRRSKLPRTAQEPDLFSILLTLTINRPILICPLTQVLKSAPQAA